MNALAKFYKNKKVLVTGHTGFKGAWLSAILAGFKADVYGYSLEPPTTPSLFDILSLKKDIHHITGDIRDFAKFERTVKKIEPDIIFHLAAQPLVRDSYDNPLYTYEANVLGTANVLEAMRINIIRAGVMITTDKVYRNSENGRAFSENDPLGGHDPYSNSKACADLVVDSYIKSFFDPEQYGKKHKTLIASARAGNVIGGGDFAQDRLVPDAMRAFIFNQKELIIRSPHAVRPFQHVLEPLHGYLLLGEKLYKKEKDKAGAFNFGPASSSMCSVSKVIGLTVAHLKTGKVKIIADKNKHEAGILKLNSKKAQNLLDWQGKYTIKQAVVETIDWYLEYKNNPTKIKDFTVNQIKEYFGA